MRSKIMEEFAAYSKYKNMLDDQMKQLPHYQYAWAYWRQLTDEAATLKSEINEPLRESQLCLCLQTEDQTIVAIFATPSSYNLGESILVIKLFHYVTSNMKQLRASYSNKDSDALTLQGE
ncbi:hypothetical protein HBH98_254710 [Parastagonospora nodorum]|nr:hypothetical protein HBH53_262020 [Parastagonospora nodorum]KAH4215327.1 hypothetical protein HBI06_256470 [Parastagonospora nodorum]KAH4222563.1 hypothetical protein HBI05_254500 [Parastagonospora nodorum]KAH4332106.1 hypothetical protein HBH98_254710 [Parastagonospora nodorum]KAH5049654.1 hypothetical protein HBI73_247240 [Parastagonospora nodorum]